MGQTVSCLNSCCTASEQVTGKSEANLVKQKNYDLKEVITLQSAIRGFMDRKKVVEYTSLKYAAKNKQAGSRRQSRQ